MKVNKARTEVLFYCLAFLLALGLRLVKLGSAPLSDVEAGWALQALNLAHGSTGGIGAQPAYILLTSLLFFVFGSTGFFARFLPALAGSLLVWFPFIALAGKRESRWLQTTGIVMAFGLALDPGLVSLSRQTGSVMPALAFNLLALACLYHRQMIWGGIFSGLALLSGPALLQGLLILAVTYGILRLTILRRNASEQEAHQADPAPNPVPRQSIWIGVIALVFTLLVAGTLFLRSPQGLGGLAETIPAYLSLWATPSQIPLLRLPAALLVYQPVVLIFALIAAVRAWFSTWEDLPTRRIVQGLSISAAVALLIPLLYPGRQVGNMAWTLIPLWAMATVEICRDFIIEEDVKTRIVAAGLSLFLFVMAVIGWINLLSIGRYQVSGLIYWAIIIGAFLLGIISLLLVAAVWSSNAARLGAVWAICIVLGLQLLSNTWGMTFLRPSGAQELWIYSPTTGQADLLAATLSDLSGWNTGLRDQLEIVDMTGSPALEWSLRNFPNFQYKDSLASNETPAVVITTKNADEPKLAQQYRGQDFIWQYYPGWQGVYPPNFINWLAFRQAPLGQDQIILWARADIFPGGAADSTGSNTP